MTPIDEQLVWSLLAEAFSPSGPPEGILVGLLVECVDTRHASSTGHECSVPDLGRQYTLDKELLICAASGKESVA